MPNLTGKRALAARDPVSDQLALLPIPSPWKPRRRDREWPHWSRWHGPTTSCDDCTQARAEGAVEMDLLRALWRVELPGGTVRLVCSVHAARRGR